MLFCRTLMIDSDGRLAAILNITNKKLRKKAKKIGKSNVVLFLLRVFFFSLNKRLRSDVVRSEKRLIR